MRKSRTISIGAILLAVLAWFIPLDGRQADGQTLNGHLHEPHQCIYPEQRCIEHRCPSGLCRVEIPDNPRPPTVRDRQYDTRQDYLLSLDEAICMALQNAEVIRVLSGQSANSTGRTIYDPAITNTQVDQARAAFDPNLRLDNGWNRTNRPGAFFDAGGPNPVLDPPSAGIAGSDADTYSFDLGLTQRKSTGGTTGLGITTSPSRIQGSSVNPERPSSLELSFRQPLLRGGGTAVNLAPVVIARIDTERSYFQLKDSIQEMVRSVVEGYWGLVLARTQLWAVEQQISQAEYAYKIFKAQQDSGSADIGDTAQSEVSLANFRASLISAQGELLNREAAFRNVLGLPPIDAVRYIPSTPPQEGRVEPDWESLIATAEQNRPDVIELKLILEADRQRRLQANNDVLPGLEAVALYRWNGLQATTPLGPLTTQFGQFADWQLGVNFSVPLGLRAERASLRQADLILARDQANIRQQMHQVSHTLAQNLRSLDQSYAQYEAFRKVRAASRINLDRIFALFDIGGLPTERIIYLNVLQAITDWGNAVSSEASALTRYNADLANLERQLGTILDNHAIHFYEEHFSAGGPKGMRHPRCYPRSVSPQCGPQRYEFGERPAEEAFDLDAIRVGSDRSRKEAPPKEENGPNSKPSPDSQSPSLDGASNAGDQGRTSSPSNAEQRAPTYTSPDPAELRERLQRLESELEANQQ